MSGFFDAIFGKDASILGGKAPVLPKAPELVATPVSPASLAQEILAILASDQGEAAAAELFKIIGVFDPVLIPLLVILAPVIQSLAQNRLAALDAGLANGAIVPDGQGGFVPSTNSHYDPDTGVFTTGPFSNL